jgi:membrane protease YdiL (CAAX protease family)
VIGVLIVFILSWLILWLFSKEHIAVLGIIPSRRRLKEFSAGFVLMAIFCSINLLGQSYFNEMSYEENSDYGILEALNGFWWTLKAVLLEELIFRGAILYILIKK